MDQRETVGIRGTGIISPLGVGIRDFTSALLDGSSAPALDADGQLAARAPGDPVALLETPKTYLDRGSVLAMAAASLARKDAGWDGDRTLDSFRHGISLGTACGCPASMVRFWDSVVVKGPRLANALFFSHSYPNIPASMEAIEHGLSGTHLTFCQGLASGAMAIVGAVDALLLHQADRMIAGGFETIPPAGALLSGAGRSSTIFFEDSTPLLSEGAAVFCLERCPAEAASGDPYFCRVAGSGAASFLPWGSSESSPLASMPRGSREGAAAAIATSMRRALQSSGHSPSDVGVVVISACGAPILDRAEAEAVVQVFGPGAIPPCTTAALRAGVAAGMMGPEAVIVAALALREEWIIEIGGRAGPDVDDLIPLVREPVESAVSVALVNSIDPDGACVTLALAR